MASFQAKIRRETLRTGENKGETQRKSDNKKYRSVPSQPEE